MTKLKSEQFCSNCQHFKPGNNKLSEGNCRKLIQRKLRSSKLPTDGWQCAYYEQHATFEVRYGPGIEPPNKKAKEETQKPTPTPKRPDTATLVEQPEIVTVTTAVAPEVETVKKSHKAKAKDLFSSLEGHYAASVKLEMTAVQVGVVISSARAARDSIERLIDKLSDIATPAKQKTQGKAKTAGRALYGSCRGE